MLTYFLKKILKSFFNAAVGIILFYTAHTLIGFVTNILFFSTLTSGPSSRQLPRQFSAR